MKIAYLEAGPLLDYWVGKAQRLQSRSLQQTARLRDMCH
jgi:hypothetical protein